MPLAQKPNADKGHTVRLGLIAVFVAAMTIRLVYIGSAPDRAWPHSVCYQGDAPLFVAFAEALRRGEPFERDLLIHSPVVPWLLSWIGPAGHRPNFTTMKVLWCILSAASCALAYAAHRRSFSTGAALIAAAWLAFSFASAVVANSLNNEVIYTFLLTCIVLMTLRWTARPGFAGAVGLGLLHGAATLTRAEHSLLLVLLLAYSIIQWRRSRGTVAAQSSGNGASSQPRRSARPHAGRELSSSAAGDRLAGSPAPPATARRIAALATVALVSVLMCIPWSIRGNRAAARLNEVATDLPDYDRAPIPWTASARAFLDGLPAFVRADNFESASAIAASAGLAAVDEPFLRRFFTEGFGYIPRPLSTRAFVSSQGPLCFALANHPEADGGFSKGALEAPGLNDPDLQLTRPSHLKLYNDGYRIGWSDIRADPVGWLRLVGAKLARFADGWTLGLSAYNLPIGRDGLRRPVDLVAPPSDGAKLWRVAVLALFVAGVVVAARRRVGGIWLLVIAYKLVVAALFFGYARQAVSILPAFAIFVAVAVDAAWGLARRRGRLPAVAGKALFAASAALLLTLDFVAAARPVRWHVEGPIVRTPRWGPDAFESVREIRLYAE